VRLNETSDRKNGRVVDCNDNRNTGSLDNLKGTGSVEEKTGS
jgi:hypothetical protein